MLKPKGIKVLGTMAMVRNSVGGGNIWNVIVEKMFVLNKEYYIKYEKVEMDKIPDVCSQ